MRKLILKMSVSLDGFVCGPNGEIDWIFKSIDAESTNWVVESIRQAGVHIMGSRTFQDMAAYWPYSKEPFAATMNEIPKIVFSRKGTVKLQHKELTTSALKDAERSRKAGSYETSSSNKLLEEWENSKVAAGDLVEEISKLKKQNGKDILAHGGTSFAQSLVMHDLIDEYRLVIHPVSLGKGQALFSALPKPMDLILISSRSFASGVIANIYRPL